MIHAITVKNYVGDSLRFELTAPEKSGAIVQSVTGLGPVTAAIHMTEFATYDGAIYNSAKAGTRNIVLNLRLLFDPTVESTRQKIYRYFPVKKKLVFTVETDNRVLETEGYVESCEPDIFSPEETVSVSILCPDAYFHSTGEDGIHRTRFWNVEPAFEFAFSNESLEEKMLVMGNVSPRATASIDYRGDAEVGMTIIIDVLDSEEAAGKVVTIQNLLMIDEQMEIDLGKIPGGILPEDKIIIQTEYGKKSIILERADETRLNALSALKQGSSWLVLRPGENVFKYALVFNSNDYALAALQVEIENREIYAGI